MNNIIHFMARLSLLYYLLWSTSIHAYAHNRDTDPNSTYPTPDRLFHIARSLNRNLVCYDANQANGHQRTRKSLLAEPGKRAGENQRIKFHTKEDGLRLQSGFSGRTYLHDHPHGLSGKGTDDLPGGGSLRLPCQDRQSAGYTTIFVCQGQP